MHPAINANSNDISFHWLPIWKKNQVSSFQPTFNQHFWKIWLFSIACWWPCKRMQDIGGKRGLWRWTAKRKHSLCQKTIFAKLQVQALILVLYLELIKLVSFPAFFHKKVFELEKWEIFFWEMYTRIWHFFLQIPGACNVLVSKRGSTSNRNRSITIINLQSMRSKKKAKCVPFCCKTVF